MALNACFEGEADRCACYEPQVHSDAHDVSLRATFDTPGKWNADKRNQEEIRKKKKKGRKEKKKGKK